MSAFDRGQLQTLISGLGLSQKEAAEVIGIGHEALSRKLAGKERYEVQESDLEPLMRLKKTVDTMVVQAVHHFVSALANEPPDNREMFPIRVLIYRSDADLPKSAGLPFASVHRTAVSRIVDHDTLQGRAASIMFDREQYDAFRGDRHDTSDLRAEWAATQKASRFAFKLAGNAIGYAVIQDSEAKNYVRKSGGVSALKRNIHSGGKK